MRWKVRDALSMAEGVEEEGRVFVVEGGRKETEVGKLESRKQSEHVGREGSCGGIGGLMRI